jgi:hypothetical protein
MILTLDREDALCGGGAAGSRMDRESRQWPLSVCARAGRPSCARCTGRQAKVAGAAKVVKGTVEAMTDEITSELQEALKS